MLVGNNIALVVYSFFMGEFLVELFPIDFFNEFTLLLIQTFISTILILVTAEFIPKAIFRIYADDFLKIFAVPAYFFFLLFHFISEFMTAISDFCLWVLFNTSDDVEQTEFSKAELEMYITEQIKKTNGNEELDSEIQIFQNALVFNDVKAREVMIPRIEILALDIGETLSAAKNLFIETGYTKIIVYKNSLDEILGYVHAFDMFKKPKSLRSIILPVEFIPESMMINDILNVLTKKKKSLAVVLDEYGGTSGLLTVEDIVEELFGEIEDEHDTLELKEVMINENEYKFSARLEVDYLNETYSLKLPEDEAYETLGGLVVYHSENIPTEKEVILIGNYEFIILTASSTKIDEIYLKISENKESS